MLRILLVALALTCVAGVAFAGGPATDVAPGPCGGCAVEPTQAGSVVAVVLVTLAALRRR